MAIIETTPRLHPAFGEVPITADDATITVTEDSEGAEDPSALKTVTLSRVPAADGTRRFDLSGFLKTLFVDRRAAKTGSLFFYNDYMLKRLYYIAGETDGDGSAVVHTAVNAIGQLNGSGSVYDIIDAGRVLRTYRPGNVLPSYEGFPVGVTITRSKSYDLNWDDALVLRLIRTGSTVGDVVLYASIEGGIIDWGDGSDFQFIDQPGRGEIRHAYAPGIHTVKIVASTMSFSYNESISLGRLSLYAIDVVSDFVKFYNFNNCSNLVSIPADLFKNQPEWSSFQGFFQGCSSLTSIPSGLFDNNPLVTDFSGVFARCRSLTSIPTGLFDNNPLVTDFSSCFYLSRNIASIPSGLFDNNPLVTNFSLCFEYTKITSIPSGLFDNNPLVTNFSSCFYGCPLTSIPAGFFSKNKNVVIFNSCFLGINTGAYLPGSTPVSDEGYKLWERAGKPGYPASISGIGCFRLQTNLADYDDIPENWQ